MDSYRAVVEVLKCADPWTVLSASAVSKRWCSAASAEELWRDLLSDQPQLCSSSKESYALLTMQRDARFCLIAVGLEAEVYDCIDNCMRHRISLQRSLQGCSAALLSITRMLVCGGEKECRDTWMMSLLDGTFQVAPQMCRGRSGHAAISVRSTVYVFGGHSKLAERAAERFSLSSNSWTKLPAMTYPRKAFNPCHKSNSIYLCGGVTTKLCEVFDITSEKYRVIMDELLCPYSCVACFYGDTLVVISEKSAHYQRGNGWEVVPVKVPIYLRNAGNMTAAVFGDFAIVRRFGERMLLKFDFITQCVLLFSDNFPRQSLKF